MTRLWGVRGEMTRGDAWTRVLLMLMSVGAGAIAALAVLGSLVAASSEEEPSASNILVPAGFAVIGIALACLGGAVARWGCVLLGAFVAFQGFSALTSMSLDRWPETRSDAVSAAVLAAVAGVGVTAIAVAVGAAVAERRPR